jgi:hypothetical protein
VEDTLRGLFYDQLGSMRFSVLKFWARKSPCRILSVARADKACPTYFLGLHHEFRHFWNQRIWMEVLLGVGFVRLTDAGPVVLSGVAEV